MQFTVADVARILSVEKNLIKTWAFKFSDYLSSKANPSKGISRKFKLEDIRVLAYIFTNWEDDPDIESIKIGLNTNSHYEHDLINNLIIEITPLFIEPPDEIDETWKHGVLFGGLSESGDIFYLANSYKRAGDRLIDIALKNEEAWDLFCPVVYNYRHAIELYLKAVLGTYKRNHDLLYLFDRFEKLLKIKFDAKIPIWFKNVLIAFNDFDPEGTAFRYGGNSAKEETFIDFIQLKTLMNWTSESFINIRRQQGMINGI